MDEPLVFDQQTSHALGVGVSSLEMQRESSPSLPEWEATSLAPEAAKNFYHFLMQPRFCGQVTTDGMQTYKLARFAELCGAGKPNAHGDVQIDGATRERMRSALWACIAPANGSVGEHGLGAVDLDQSTHSHPPTV